MVRRRVQLKPIENKLSRQVTFLKRRTGLLKKAREISVLCDAEVALIIFSANGKLYEYSSDSSMEGTLEKYEKIYAETTVAATNSTSCQELLPHELRRLTSRIELLQTSIRHYGGEDLDPLNLRELQSLEVQMDAALKRIRTTKNRIMNDSISELQKKERALQEKNNAIVKKIENQLKEKQKEIDAHPLEKEYQISSAQDTSTTNLPPNLLQLLPPPLSMIGG